MDIPVFDRIFSFFSEARQREKLLVLLRQYFFENPVAITAVILGCVSLIISLFTGRMREKNRWRADWACLFGYFAALILLLVFSRYWQGFHETNVLITVVNALVFIPFGSLLRKASESWMPELRKKLGFAAGLTAALLRLPIVLAAGVAIEGMQYVFARGNSALLDVIAYSAGSILGMLFMGIWLLIKGSYRKKEEIG